MKPYSTCSSVTSRTARDTAMPPGSAMAWMRAATLTPSPKIAWVSSSVMTSPRCTPMRNIRRRSSSSLPLKCAMRSWMSIAVATAATAEFELGQHQVADEVHHPPTRAFDGGPPDVGLDGLEMRHGAILAAFHQAREAAEVGVQDGGEAAARRTCPVCPQPKPHRGRARQRDRRRPCPSCPSRTLCKRASVSAPASSTVRHSIIRRYRPSCDRGHTTGNIRRRQVPRATTCSSAPRSRTMIRPRP